MRVRGPINQKKTVLSGDRLAALQSGDIDALLAINRAEFGGFKMEDPPDDGGDGGDDDDTGGDGGDDDGDKGGSDTPSVEDLARQLAETEKRMKAADKRADAAEKKIKDAEKAEQGELEQAKTEVEELKASVAEKDKVIRELRLNNAFLTANKHTWHDPDTALSLADSGGYLEDVVDDEGQVDKKVLGSALDRLAKDKAYLIKTEEKKDDDDGTPSGEPAGGRSDNSKDAAARKKQLRGRFPALNR